jgi:hypothetical protein
MSCESSEQGRTGGRKKDGTRPKAGMKVAGGRRSPASQSMLTAFIGPREQNQLPVILFTVLSPLSDDRCDPASRTKREETL